ncbi:hypothetical protein LG047_07775 [Methylocystis sp. WRRC1]|uniref:hypothetical protein n=1 Tax=Methylocystis sp. WRRC1 TaxID=1732014 RepID=UPI001D15CBA5|nr:hypothetical protein [Methylocystis sp. WRRC1]MCC3245218.1 hypothetical protein [Methylocystis sp. WRRC1]
MRFKKDGAVKGSTAADLSASVAHAVVSAEFGSIEDRIEKGRHARAGSFTLAGKIEACLSIIVDDISADPSTAYRHGQSLKALERAMATAERGFLLKEKALGLTAAETIDPLPIIEIRDLGESDIEAIRAVNDDGDDLPDAAAADV